MITQSKLAKACAWMMVAAAILSGAHDNSFNAVLYAVVICNNLLTLAVRSDPLLQSNAKWKIMFNSAIYNCAWAICFIKQNDIQLMKMTQSLFVTLLISCVAVIGIDIGANWMIETNSPSTHPVVESIKNIFVALLSVMNVAGVKYEFELINAAGIATSAIASIFFVTILQPTTAENKEKNNKKKILLP